MGMIFSLLKKLVLTVIFLGLVYFVANAFKLIPEQYTPEVLYPEYFKAADKDPENSAQQSEDAATADENGAKKDDNVVTAPINKAKETVQDFQNKLDQQQQELDNN
jgi:hypothetical protein